MSSFDLPATDLFIKLVWFVLFPVTFFDVGGIDFGKPEKSNTVQQ